MSSEHLSGADPTARLGARFYRVPESLEGLSEVASKITRGAYSDVARMRRIVTFLGRNYEFDQEASDQLDLTVAPEGFLARGTAGTSMDFASATVLLARAAGVPARLVTGYLPGRLDPLSGTYVVHEGDRHAWSEIYLGGIGWVPFDSSPRHAAASYGEGSGYRSPVVSAIFGAGYGDDIYRSINSSPRWIGGLAEAAVDETTGHVTAIGLSGLAVAILIAGGIGALRLTRRLRGRGRRARYSRIQGDGRAETLDLYRRTEKLLRRAGLAARAPWQTLGEYADQARSSVGDAAADIEWLRRAAWAAAYSPDPYDAGLLVQCQRRVELLRAGLKDRR